MLQGRLAPFRKNYPPFFAPTGSCARPNPSRRLRLSPYTAGLCRLLSVPAGRWPFPTLDLRVFPWMLGPVPRRFVRCTCSFLPSQHRPSPRNENGSANHKIFRSATSERALSSRSLSFLTVGPPSLRATPVAPTAVVDGSLYSFPPAWSHGRRWAWGLLRRCPTRHFLTYRAAVAFTSEQNTCRCLHVHRIC